MIALSGFCCLCIPAQSAPPFPPNTEHPNTVTTCFPQLPSGGSGFSVRQRFQKGSAFHSGPVPPVAVRRSEVASDPKATPNGAFPARESFKEKTGEYHGTKESNHERKRLPQRAIWEGEQGYV